MRSAMRLTMLLLATSALGACASSIQIATPGVAEGDLLVAFTALVLTGDSLQAITANSGALNSGHIQVTLDQPVQNTLVSVLICALAHWRLGAGSRATSVPE